MQLKSINWLEREGERSCPRPWHQGESS